MANYPEYVKSSEGAKILGVESKLFFYYAKKRNVRTKPGDGERKPGADQTGAAVKK